MAWGNKATTYAELTAKRDAARGWAAAVAARRCAGCGAGYAPFGYVRVGRPPLWACLACRAAVEAGAT